MDQQTILDFWFVDPETSRRDQPRGNFWFKGGKQLDQEIRSTFEASILAAALGEFEDWQSTAKGSLALILLYDQFARNVYRGSERAFAFEHQALATARHALLHNFPGKLSILERVFLYMPFEHSESVVDQALSLELFTDLHKDAPPELAEFTQRTLDSAMEHKAIINEFARYPHRNAVLNRESTAEEITWLANKGKRFGQ